MQGLSRFLWLFHNEFNKFDDTGARMLDSIDHMTVKLFLIALFVWKRQAFAKYTPVVMGILHNVTKIGEPQVVCRIYYIALYHS